MSMGSRTLFDGTHWAKGNPVPIPEPGSGTVPKRALIRVLDGATQRDPETPSGDPERVFFSL
jgi:hypothetical protein